MHSFDIYSTLDLAKNVYMYFVYGVHLFCIFSILVLAYNTVHFIAEWFSKIFELNCLNSDIIPL